MKIVEKRAFEVGSNEVVLLAFVASTTALAVLSILATLAAAVRAGR